MRMKSTSRAGWFFTGLLIASAAVAGEMSAELRGFGSCAFSSAERKFGGEEVSVATFVAASPEKARMVGGKFIYELRLSHGVERRGTETRPWFATPGGQGFAVAVVGSECRIASGSADAVAKAAADALFAPDGALIESGVFPEYMKRMGWGSYGMGGFDNMLGWMSLDGKGGEKDPEEDFQFHLLMDDGKSGPMHFDQWLDPATFDNSDGLLANQGIPWKARLAEKLGIPTSFRVYGIAGGFDWSLRRFPDFMNQPADFMVNGWLRYHDVAPHFSWYQPEAHKYVARTVMDGMRKVKTPNTRGWMHPHGELFHQYWYDMHQDYSPAAAKSWHDYLASKGETPSSAEDLFGVPSGSYATWDDVPVPEFAHFSGLQGRVLDLFGTWRWRKEFDFQDGKDGWWEKSEEERYPGIREKWYLPETDLSQWGSIDMPGSPEFIRRIFPKQVGWGADGSTSACWFRRDFEWKGALASGKPVWLYFFPMSDSSVHTPGTGNRLHRIYVNGREVGGVGQWGALDVTEFLAEGRNTVAIQLHGCWWKGRAFLSVEPPRTYPGLLAGRDRLWGLWESWRRDAKYEAWKIILDGMRQVDPDAPIKFMAPEGFGTETTHRLCLDWGGFPHFTGEGIWFYPWYKRYAKLYGIPASSELAGPSNNEREMRMSTLRVFLEGLDGHEPVFQTQVYSRKSDLREFWLSHKNVLRRMGTYDIFGPQVIIYRRATGTGDFTAPYPVPGGKGAYAKASVWNWDLGRGTLQSIGQSPLYIDDSGIADGKLEGQSLVIDCGNETMTRETVERIRDWVERGGTFVAFPFTGRSTPDKVDAWPISALTGCRVKSVRPLGGSVTFDDAQEMPAAFRARTFRDEGRVMDWQGNNHNEYSVELEPGDGSFVAARFENGSAAIVVRPLGKGRVVAMGSMFWRDVADTMGIWVPGEGERTAMRAILEGLAFPKPLGETDDARVWAQPYRSNNGVDSVTVLCNFNESGTQNVGVTLRPGRKPASLVVYTPGAAAKVPFEWDAESGEARFRVDLRSQDVAIVEAETFGGADSVAYWWNRQQELWHPLVKPSIDFEPYRSGRWADPTMELAEDARFTNEKPGEGWDRDAAYDDSAWTAAPVSIPYFWGAKPGEGVWYRKTFDAGEEWRDGSRVTLVSGQWQGGRQQYMTPTRMILNGRELHEFKTGHYDAFDVTDLLRPQGNVLAFEMQGGAKYVGMTGKVYLYRREKPVDSIDLAGEWRERTVRIPAEWKGRRVRVWMKCGSGTPLGVRINGYVARRHHHGFGEETDVDITNHVRFGEDNVLYAIPDADANFDDRPVRFAECRLDCF